MSIDNFQNQRDERKKTITIENLLIDVLKTERGKREESGLRSRQSDYLLNLIDRLLFFTPHTPRRPLLSFIICYCYYQQSTVTVTPVVRSDIYLMLGQTSFLFK